MKKVFFSLLMLMLASAAWAFDVTFDATLDVATGGTTAGEYTINKDCVTMHIEQGMTNGSQYRFYKGKKVTFTSECGPITRIVFTCVGEDYDQYGPGGFTSDLPEYSPMGHLGIWASAGASQVVFTASNFQVRVTKIVVTVGGEIGLLPPRITPSGGIYYGSINVSIDCSTEGAEIYYTIDGSEPTTASTQYTAPFTITPPITVKAISARDGETSDVVTAQYEMGADHCLGDLEDLPDGEAVVFNHELTVLYQKGNYLYVRDECEQVYNYGQVYGSTGQIYYTGDIIPPGCGGRKTTYQGRPELINPTGFQPSIRSELIEPELITIPQVGEQTLWHYVVLKDVYIDYENQVVRDQEGNTCPYYPQLTQWVDPTQLQTIYAIVTAYKSSFQLLIIEEGFPLPPPLVCCLTDLYDNLEKGKVAQFDCPLTVIYHNGAYLYVKDSCGNYGLIYGANQGGPFENGDLIIGQASWTVYQNCKQLTNRGEWTKVGKTDPVEPIVMPIEELCADMVHMFVKLENVNLTEFENHSYIEDETGDVLMFNRFQVEIQEGYGGGGYVLKPDVNHDNEVNIADVNCIIDLILKGLTSYVWVDGDGTYDVIGFVAVYHGEIEIIPIKIVHHGTNFLDGDVNGDGEVNIADVNCIIDIILGYKPIDY